MILSSLSCRVSEKTLFDNQKLATKKRSLFMGSLQTVDKSVKTRDVYGLFLYN